jgi:CRISPR-associated protein Cmr3
LPLGGENRLADCRTGSDLVLPDFVTEPNAVSPQVTATLLTPMLPPDSVDGKVTMPQPNKQFFDWPGTTVISACVGKPQALGGWDSIRKEPLPLRPVLPAGSTWFLKTDNPQALAAYAARGIGLKAAYGFGQVALGIWPTSQGDSSQ